MTEDQRVYDFGDHVTSSKELAEIFFDLKKMEAVFELSENEPVPSLVEKQTAVCGYVSRMKSALLDFMERAYKTDENNISGNSYAGRIVKNLDEMKKKTFYFQEKALQLPAEKIKANLSDAARLAAELPSMVAALDAGEDEAR